MPVYSFRCTCGEEVDRYIPLKSYLPGQVLRCSKCFGVMSRIITAPLMVSAQVECRYDSPVDGRIITTHAQRRDDLDRKNCIPYDPEMKTDKQRRIKDDERELDRQVDAHVESTIEKMDSKTRGKLYSELAYQGKSVEYWRGTKDS